MRRRRAAKPDGRRSRGMRILVAISLPVVLVLASTPAVALPATPDDTWQTNGPVLDVIKVGGTIFLGGDFSQLRETPVGDDSGDVIPANNFAALDANTGDPAFANPPDFTGSGKDAINSLAYGGGKLWVGGKFTQVDGAPRRNIAALDPDTLNLDNATPKTGGPTFALASDGSKLFAGGSFTSANNDTRIRLAAFSFSGGLDQDWTPSADAKVRDMAVTPDGTGLFITGDFKNINGQERNAIARLNLNTATGNLTDWAPTGTVSPKVRGMGVNTTSDRLYWAVAQTDWVGAFHIDTGRRIFKTDTDGTVNDAVEIDNRVIIGGHFVYVAKTPSVNTCTTEQGQEEDCEWHSKIAALELDGDLDDTWTVGLRGGAEAWQGPQRFLVDGSSLWIGGMFLSIDPTFSEPAGGGGDGQDQTYFGRLI
jgi:hypothetical protein